MTRSSGSLMLYNRGAQCCFNSGSAPKLGAGAVCSGRVGMFQRNSDQNTAAWSQCNCSSAIRSTSRPVHTAFRAQVCVGQEVIVRADLYSGFPDYRWEPLILAGPFIARGLLLRALLLRPTHVAQPHLPLLLTSICMFCRSVWSACKISTQTTQHLLHAITASMQSSDGAFASAPDLNHLRM